MERNESSSESLREAIPSAYNLISANRSIGYTLSSAIADIIDNSISAGAKEVQLLSPPSPYPVLKIIDDGHGMDLAELDEAMKFGGNRDCFAKRGPMDLGRFGMGLKTATLSQCKCLKVVTKKHGEMIGGCWDLDFLKDNDSWKYLVIEAEKCSELIKGTLLENTEHGTAVIWNKFDRLSDKSDGGRNAVFAYQLERAVEKLELVFHRFLSGEEGLNRLTIEYNGHQLKPNDPFLINRIPDYSKPREIPVENDFISVYPHKLPHPKQLSKEEIDRLTLGSTLLETQGFYVYRAKRLIDYGTWFSLAPKLDRTKLSRIQIDIPNSLDHVWSIDIKKSRTILPQGIRDDLKSILDVNNENSVKTFSRKGRIRKEAYPIWLRTIKDKEVHYSVNSEHPLVSAFLRTVSEEQGHQFATILNMISSSLSEIMNQIQLDMQNDLQVNNNQVDNSENRLLYDQVKVMMDLGVDDDVIISCIKDPSVAEIIRRIRGIK